MAQWRGRGQRRRGGDDDNNDDNNDDPALTIVHVRRVSLICFLLLKMIKIYFTDGRRATGGRQPPLLLSHIVGYYENCIVARPRRCRDYLIFLS